MRFYADLEIHSKYYRTTDKDCDLGNLVFWVWKTSTSVNGTATSRIRR